MKKYIVILVAGMLIGVGNAKAQSIAQLTEQLVMDMEKLADLKNILSDMYKGYQILDKGYSEIKSIAQGNFTLHKVFLDGLLAVSPVVKNYSRVAGIIQAEYTLVTEYKAAYKKFRADGHFTPQELDYIGKVYAGLFSQSLKGVDELTMVVTADALRMPDSDRLGVIDRVWTDITGQLGALRSFNNGISVQAIQRAREANDGQTLKSIYGINK